MLGSAYYLIGALALVLLQPGAALNATTANAVCNLLEDGILIYSGEDCSQYYSCSDGLATLASCSSGYYFSKDNQGCMPSSQVTCGASDNPCANVADGLFVAVPNSCTGFYYCNNGVGTLGNCPSGLNFDPVDQSCNYTTDYICGGTNSGGSNVPTINLCSVIPNGIFFGSSTSCQAWQECKNGALSVGVCPSPFYYNVDTAACDYQENVSCRQVNGDSSTGTNAGYLAGTSCSTNGLTVSDNMTCVGYYTCNNNIYSYGTCTGGLYYNPPTQSCVNRLDALNNCNRCEDTTLEFVNLYQDNCVGYGYCNNGQVQSTGTCPDGYFDEVAEACVVESQEPQYLVCNDELAGLTTDASTTGGSTSSDSSSGSTAAATTADSSTAAATTIAATTTATAATTTEATTTTTEATTTT